MNSDDPPYFWTSLKREYDIAREHWGMGDKRSRRRSAIEAVAEVGNPTIVATLTVVAALLPMLFVSGMMGPYMSPIPANASAAMLFSFFVAVMVTPWLMLKVAGKAAVVHGRHDAAGGRLGAAYAAVARPILASKARNSASVVPPLNTKPPAVDIIGPHIADLKFTCHFFSNVFTSQAWTAPIWSLAASVGVISRPEPR